MWVQYNLCTGLIISFGQDTQIFSKRQHTYIFSTMNLLSTVLVLLLFLSFFTVFVCKQILTQNQDSVCECLCVCVCVSLAIDSLETVDVIIVNLCTVTASDMGMHHVLIILTLTFIQGHTDLNHENNKCLIISETTNNGK